MALIPLLPKPKVQDWPHQSGAGLHSITDQDYQRNLCENYYEASDYGTPSPLACAIVFAERLDQYLLDQQGEAPSGRFEDVFEIWSLLLKGLYLGIVKVREVKLSELRELGQIVEAELAADCPFAFLTLDDNVVGFTYPGIGLAPGVRLGGEALERLRREVEAKDVEKASEYFVGWVHTFDERDQGSLPFYPLIYHLAARWNPSARTDLVRDPGRLFGSGPSLWLTAAQLPEEVARPRVPLYIGTPIICDYCGYEIGEEVGLLEVRNPDECRCPSCQTKHDWLGEYSEWIRFSEERGIYVIYALAGSPLRRPPYSKYVEYKEDGVVIRTGRFALKVYGLIISEEALKCTRLLFFTDEGRVREPDLPVRGEYYGLVELAKNRRPYHDQVSGDYIVTLDVAGWDEHITIRYSAKEIQQEEALLLSWPNFKLPGWSAYFYLLESEPRMFKAGMALRALDSKAQPMLLEASRGRVEHPFEAFEVVFTKKGAVDKQAGIFKTSRFSLAKGESPLTIALDFGTSSSCIWYRLGDGEAQVLRFRDFTGTVIPNKILSDKCLDLSYWLPTYRLDDPETAAAFYRGQLDTDDSMPADPEGIVEKLDYFIPSELIVWPPLSAESLEKPLSGFRICHTYAARPHGEVIYDLKTLDVKGHPEGRFTYEQGVTRYLEFFLVLALATIINDEERAGYLKVRASFPRAFSQEKVRLYLGCLDKVLSNVEKLTGIAAQPPLYIDESRAAALSVRVPEGLSLVMDMGGGTTDIGVFEWDDGKLKPIFIDSLLYGANAFLRLLASGKAADLFPKPTEKSSDRLLWLLRETRMRGFDTVVRTQYRGNAHAREAMLDLLLRFYSPLVHFVRRLFEAIPLHRGEEKDYRTEQVTYYLVGNGWRLGDAIHPQDPSYQVGHQEIVRYLLEKEGFTALTPAKEPTFDGGSVRWPGPKGAVGCGTIEAEENLLYRTIDAAAAEVNGARSIAGFDLHLTDGSSKPVPVSWHQEIPHRIEKRNLRPVLDGIELPKDWRSFIKFEKGAEVQALERTCAEDVRGVERPLLTRSFMVRFLEKIYLEQLHQARRL